MAGNFENVGYSKEGKECIYNILIMEEKQTINSMWSWSKQLRLFSIMSRMIIIQ